MVSLFPLDHTIGIIVEYNDSHIELKFDCSFKISKIHHKSAVSDHRDDLFFRRKYFCHHGRGVSCSHRSQGIV